MPDAFDLLGIEPRFAIDAVELDQRHRDLLSQLHPDRNPAPDAPDAREAHAASLARGLTLGDPMPWPWLSLAVLLAYGVTGVWVAAWIARRRLTR